MRTLIRRLARDRGFTLNTVLVLALGVGANTAIFSVVRAVLLRPLPYPEPDRITVLAETNQRGAHIQVSGADYRDWRAQAASFSAMASYFADSSSIFAGGQAERLNVTVVDSGWFDVMGTRPQIGRLFDPDEEKPGSEPAAIISDSLWRRRFAGDAGVLGTKIKVSGAPYAIAGVMPPGFRFPEKTDVWVPLGLFPDSSARSAHNYRVIARLKNGVSAGTAQAEMRAIAARLEKEYPDSNAGIGAAVTPLGLDLTGNFRPTLWLLSAAAAFILLIACANAGGLLLARGARRRAEFAVRAALGAGRGHLIRELLAESLAISLCAGVLAIAIAWWSGDALIALAPGSVPRLGDARVDWTVLAFAFGSAIVTGLLFGLVPGIQISRADVAGAIRQAGRGTAGCQNTWLRWMLVSSEIALSVILVSGAGLAVRTLLALERSPKGYDSSNVLVLDTVVPANNDAEARRGMRTYEELLRRAAALPGVLAAGAITSVPLSEQGSSNGVFFEGAAFSEGMTIDRTKYAGFHAASGGYFRALGIPLLAGRTFDERDQFEAPHVCVISATMARQYWPKGDALGRRITTGYDQNSSNMEIVGVVGDVRHIGLDAPARAEIYMPFEQHPRHAAELSIVVKAGNDAAALVEPLRAELRRLDAEMPVEFTTADAIGARSTGSPRFRAALLGAFGALALAIAAIGVYGLVSFLAAERVREIGVRMALGADAAGIARLIVLGSLRAMGAGFAAGVALSFGLTRYMRSFLYGVSPFDPLTYAWMCVILAAAVIAASALPAWRASRVDPARALRTT